MIYSKGKYWKIRGKLGLYNSMEEALAAEAAQQAEARGEEPPKPITKTQIIEPAENTPYENMIEKTVCKLCDLEPCECFTFIKKTEPGL